MAKDRSEYRRKYYEEHHEEMLESFRERYRKKGDAIKAQARERYRKEYMKRYREEHQAKIAGYKCKYAKKRRGGRFYKQQQMEMESLQDDAETAENRKRAYMEWLKGHARRIKELRTERTKNGD